MIDEQKKLIEKIRDLGHNHKMAQSWRDDCQACLAGKILELEALQTDE